MSQPVQPQSSPTEIVTFTICTTAAQVHGAVSVLSQHRFVCLDCEGRDFGKLNGTLSLLSLGTPVASDKQHVFILDIPSLLVNPEARDVLSAFLISDATTKVTYDGRCDYLEIRDALGVDVQPVLDLQLAESLALGRRGMVRLFYFSARYVKSNKELFEGMRRIIGMDEATRTYVPNLVLPKHDAVKEMHRRNESYRWMDRPLSDELLSYAACDVRAIAHLLKTFRSRHIIPSNASPELPKLMRKSTRYVTRNGVSTRAQFNAPGEFALFAGDRTLYFPIALSGPLQMLLACHTCGSNLPLVCFQVRDARRRVQCRACVAWVQAPKIGKHVRATAEALPGHSVESDWVDLGA